MIRRKYNLMVYISYLTSMPTGPHEFFRNIKSSHENFFALIQSNKCFSTFKYKWIFNIMHPFQNNCVESKTLAMSSVNWWISINLEENDLKKFQIRETPTVWLLFFFLSRIKAADKRFWCKRPHSLSHIDPERWQNISQPDDNCHIKNYNWTEISNTHILVS